MKKTILSLLFIGTCWVLLAQEVKIDNEKTKNKTMISTSKYPAFQVTVPPTVQHYFIRDYPVTSEIIWQQPDRDWYMASYRNNGRNMFVYYHLNGSTYSVALPVIQSYVPEEVISKAIDLYGTNTYAITAMKTTDGKDVYHVTVLDKEATRTEWINADGSSATAPVRTEIVVDNSNMNNQSNTTVTDNQSKVLDEKNANMDMKNKDMNSDKKSTQK